VKLGFACAGRYVLLAPGAFSVPSAEVWHAHDTRLGLPVIVLVAESSGRASLLDAIERARTIRDPRFARVIESGLIESETTEDAGRPYAVLESPEGLSVASLLARRFVPAPVARALVGEATRVVAAAAERGLRHGEIVPELLTVTNRGRVVLAGAGVVEAFVASSPGRRSVTERDDALALGTLFVRAVSGEDPVDLPTEKLPPDLTRAERDLAYVLSHGSARPSLSNIVRVLGTWDPSLLRTLSTDLRHFPRRAYEPVVEAAPITDEIPVLDAAAAPAAAPTITDEEAAWSLDTFEDVAVIEDTPSILEAVLSALSRRFPRFSPITRALEKVRARVTGGPQINATRWFLLGGFVAIVLIGIWAIQWVTSPYVPTIDLHNPPPQEYPEFTFGPSASPSADS